MTRILVVDDDVTVRHVLKLQLSKAGFEVEAASTGSEALRLHGERTADLVVLDIHLPGEDGFEVCQALRKQAEVPVIFLTGTQESIIRDHLPELVKAVGGAYFVGKPVDVQILLKLIQELIPAVEQAATKP